LRIGDARHNRRYAVAISNVVGSNASSCRGSVPGDGRARRADVQGRIDVLYHPCGSRECVVEPGTFEFRAKHHDLPPRIANAVFSVGGILRPAKLDFEWSRGSRPGAAAVRGVHCRYAKGVPSRPNVRRAASER
jgi:hypothetical protein